MDGGNNVEAARRRLFLLMMTLVFTLIVLSSLTEEADKTNDGGNNAGGGAGGGGGILPPDPNVARLAALADSIALQSIGPVYPSNLSATERFVGSWGLEGPYTDSRAVRPLLTPNLTIGFAAFGPTEPPAQEIDFQGFQKGALSLSLVSMPILRAVPTLQRVDGLLTLTTAQAMTGLEDEPLAVRADLPISGLYVSDEGVLSMAYSPRKVEVFLAEKVPLPPVTAEGKTEGKGRELQSTPDPSPSPAEPSPVPVPSPVPSPSPAVNDLGLGRCEILFTFRLRPVAWDYSEGQQYADGGEGGDDSGDAPGGEQSQGTAGRRLLSSASSSELHAEELSRQVAQLRGQGEDDSSSWLRMASKVVRSLGFGRTLLNGKHNGGGDSSSDMTDRALAMQLERLIQEERKEGQKDHSIAAAPRSLSTEGLPSPRSRAASGGRGGRRLESTVMSELYPGARFVPIYGKAVSHNCNFALNVTATTLHWSSSHFDEKAIAYTLMATSVGVILMAATTFQLVRSASQSAASRISVATLGILAALDGYAALAHVLGGLTTPQVFSSFLTTSFVFLLLFAVLEMRFLLMVWKARRPDVFSAGWDAVRREVGQLYCRFYGVLIGGMFLLWFGGWTGLRILALLAFSFWVPQIIHSVQHDVRPGLTQGYVLTTSVVRLLIPAYFLACPDNLILMLTPPETRQGALSWTSGWTGQFEAWLMPSPPLGSSAVPQDDNSPQTPPPWLVQEGAIPSTDASFAFVSAAATASYQSGLRFLYLLCGWVALQAFVLVFQGKSGWGPRWFIPYVYLPQRYDYHRKIAITSDGRIVPDPAACLAWLRPRQQQQQAAAAAAAQAAGGNGNGNANGNASSPAATAQQGSENGAPAAAAPPSRFSSFLSSVRRGTEERARFAWVTTVWFFNGLRVLARDGAKNIRRRAVRIGLVAPSSSPRNNNNNSSSPANAHAARAVEMRAMPSSSSSSSSDAGTGAAAPTATVTSPVAALAAAASGLGASGRRGGYARIEEKSSDAAGEDDEDEEQDDEEVGRGGGRGRSAAPARAGAAAAERSGAAGSASLAEEGRATPTATSSAAPRGEGNNNDSDAAGAGGGGAPVDAAAERARAQAAAAAAESRELELDELVVPEGGGEATFDCAICMDSIAFPTQRRSYLICPCDHIFHPDCLEPWLAQKLECPSCRLTLPEP